MKSAVLQKLEKQIGTLTSAQKQVADLILKKPTDAAFMTLDQIAAAAGTSTTTVIRLAYSLGFRGFADFQRSLQELLRNRVAPTLRLDTNLKNLSPSRLLVECAKKQINNIKATTDFLSDEVLDKCVDLIIAAPKIHIIGARTSYSAAYFLYQQLNNITGKCHLLKAASHSIVETLIDITPDDLVIAISLPRYARSTVDLIKFIRQNQRPHVVVISDGYSVPLAAFADIILPVAFGSLASHNSVIGSIFICDYLITATSLRQPEQTKRRLEAAEALFQQLDYHLDK